MKAVLAEPVLAARLERLLLPFRERGLRETVRTVLADRSNVDPPSLTEVVLTTLLHQAGLPYDRMELDDLVAQPAEAERKLAATSCVFLSSTYLHDLCELEPLVRRLKRAHNRVVVGGALAGILHNAWDGHAGGGRPRRRLRRAADRLAGRLDPLRLHGAGAAGRRASGAQGVDGVSVQRRAGGAEPRRSARAGLGAGDARPRAAGPALPDGVLRERARLPVPLQFL